MKTRVSLLLLIIVCGSPAWADELRDYITTRTVSPDGRLAISLDGSTEPSSQGDDTPTQVHQARLFDLKARKFIGRKMPLTLLSAPIDTQDRSDNQEGWRAIWHPKGSFVVLAAPLLKKRDESPRAAYFYFQVSDTGLWPMRLPDLQPHAVRAFDSDDVITVTEVIPHEWTTHNRLYITVGGTYAFSTESPDFRARALLKFSPDGNVTVDAFFDLGHL